METQGEQSDKTELQKTKDEQVFQLLLTGFDHLSPAD